MRTREITMTVQEIHPTGTTDPAEADRALKARHRAMWALGDYSAVASEIIDPLGPVLVEAAGHDRGDGVLEWEYLLVTARRC
jgi:proteasome lid subunit RPN8/RPN11